MILSQVNNKEIPNQHFISHSETVKVIELLKFGMIKIFMLLISFNQ